MNHSFQKKREEEKNHVWHRLMKFVLEQTVHQTFAPSLNQIYAFHGFELNFIKHLFFHHCVERKT